MGKTRQADQGYAKKGLKVNNWRKGKRTHRKGNEFVGGKSK